MKNQLCILGTLVLLFVLTSATSQTKFELVGEQDGVSVFAKWKPSKFMKKDSPKTLCLMVVNENSHPVTTTFNTAFFAGGFSKEKSAPLTVCVKAGKSKKGRKHGLCLVSSDENDDLKNDENIDFEIEHLAVQECDSCPKK